MTLPTKAELNEFVEEYWGSMKGFYPGGYETIYTPFELIAREHFANFARDVLARWGRPTPQPANGEVAELVDWLLASASYHDAVNDEEEAADSCRRVASLLERLSPPHPIPVSERLPGPEDCDSQGRCWGFHQYNREDDDIWESWYLVPTQHLLPSVQWLGFSHWLPANALPQPS